MKTIAAIPRTYWLLICVCSAVGIFAAYNWESELVLWKGMALAGYSTPAIIAGIVASWVRNRFFLAMIVVVFSLAWEIQVKARKSN